MSIKFKNGDDVSDSIGLLISILVRYPEVGSIHFDPQSHGLKLIFIMAGTLDDRETLALTEKITESIETYYQLEKIKPQVMSLTWQCNDGYTILELKRDIDTLSRDELSFIIELFELHFHRVLVVDTCEELFEEDLQIQEEIIGHMLENMKNGLPDKKLIAYREEGKVLVFNK